VVNSVKGSAEVQKVEQGHLAIIYGMDKVIMDREESCFGTAERSVYILLCRQEI